MAAHVLETSARGNDKRQKFLVNLKHMSPEKYAGLRCSTTFRTWSQDIKDLVARFSVELLDAMTATENQAERIASDTIPSSVHDEDAQLRSALRAFTVGEPRAVINAAIDRGDSGLEIWRMLTTQYDPNNDTTRLDESTYILNPGRAKNMSEVQLLLTKWEDAMNHRSKMLGRTALDDDLKRSVLLKLLPNAEESELRHQRILFKTYEALRGRVIELISERTKGPAPMLHHFAKEDPEDVQNLEEDGEWIMRIEESGGRQHRVWSQAKGKGKGKSKGKGKGKAQEGKGKSKGKGMECYRCGRVGHLRADCYSKKHISGSEPREISSKLNNIEGDESDTELHGIDICMLEPDEGWTTVIRKRQQAVADPFAPLAQPRPLIMVNPFDAPKHFLADPFLASQPARHAIAHVPETSAREDPFLSSQRARHPVAHVPETSARNDEEQAPLTWTDDEEWAEEDDWWNYTEEINCPSEAPRRSDIGRHLPSVSFGATTFVEPAPGLRDPAGRAPAVRAAAPAAPSGISDKSLQQALDTLAAAAAAVSANLGTTNKTVHTTSVSSQTNVIGSTSFGIQTDAVVAFVSTCVGTDVDTEALHVTNSSGAYFEASANSSGAYFEASALHVTNSSGAYFEASANSSGAYFEASALHVTNSSGAHFEAHIGSSSEGSDYDDISSEDFTAEGSSWLDTMDGKTQPEFELQAVDAMDVEKSGWNRFDIVVDSGAAQSVADGNLWPSIKRAESEGSRSGAVYLGPGKERIPNRGQKTMNVKTAGSSTVRKMTFQDAAIRKPLAAVSGITDKGNVVLFDKKGSFIAPEDAPEVKTIRELIRQVKNRIQLEERKGIYIMPIWVQDPEAAGVFSRPGH
jgi:hypothetical protein